MRTAFRYWMMVALWGSGILGVPRGSMAEGLLGSYLYPPHSRVENVSLGEWSSLWWKWAFTHKGPQDPVRDTTGRLAGVAQAEHSPVWFLAGTYSSGKVIRRCEIPSGHPLFLPLINFYVLGHKDNAMNCETTSKLCREGSADVTGLFFKLDGESLPNPKDYLEESEACFDVPSAGFVNVFASGYWVMLRPLPPGEHILQFGGVPIQGSSQDIEYHVSVLSPPKKILPIPETGGVPGAALPRLTVVPERSPHGDTFQPIEFTVPPVSFFVKFDDGPGQYQVEVVEAGGSSLKTLYDKRVVDSKEAWLEWDGLSPGGQLVPPGQYYIILHKDGKTLKSILLIRK